MEKFIKNLILAVFCLMIFWACNSNDRSVTSKDNLKKSYVRSKQVPSETLALLPKVESIQRSDDWTMLLYDIGQSGRSPDRSLKPPLELKWKFKTGGQITASPVVADDRVYVGSNDNRLYALNTKEWGELWNFRADSKILFSPTVWNKTVYFNTSDSIIYALDAETGELKWKFKTESWMESPVVVSKGRVFAGVFKRSICVLNAHTGKLIDKRSVKIMIDGTLYVCNDGKFRPSNRDQTLNILLKKEFWQQKTPNSISSPVFANGVVYIGASNNKLYAFDQETEEEVWTYEMNGSIDAAPAISEGMLYVVSRDGYVYAFENFVSERSRRDQNTDQRFGIVTHDQALVYTLPDESADKLAVVNDGVSLPIIDRKPDWHKVQLPNGKIGWMNKYDFAQFKEYNRSFDRSNASVPLGTELVDQNKNGILLNSDIINGVKNLALPEGAELPQWSPDEQTIAFLVRTDLRGRYWKATQLWISEADTGSSKQISDGLFYNPNLSWSLDSKWIAFEAYYMDSPYVWIIQRRGWDVNRLVLGNAPAFSPKSHQIALRLWEGGKDLLFRVNIDRSGLRQLAQMPIEGQVTQFNYLDKPVWSPDGERIAIGIDSQHYKHGYARILIVNKDGKKFQTIFTRSDDVQRMQWHPDGQKLLYVLSGNHGDEVDETLDKRIVITELNRPKTPVGQGATTRIARYKHTLPTWSPDGRWIIFAEREDCMGLKWKIWIANPVSGRVIPFARANQNISSIDWLEKGICIWSTSGYIRSGKYQPAKTTGWLVDCRSKDLQYEEIQK